MECSLGMSNFLVAISSLSHSTIFLYFFALITEEGFLISPCYSLELCIQVDISFLFSFAFRFSSFLSYLKAYSDSHFAFFAFLLLGDDFDHRLLYSVTRVRPSFLAGTVSIRSDPLNAWGSALPVVSRQCWCFVLKLLQHLLWEEVGPPATAGGWGPGTPPRDPEEEPRDECQGTGSGWDACRSDWHRAVWSGGCPCVLAPPAWSWGESVLRGWVETKWAWQQWLEARGAWWQGELAKLQPPTSSGPGLPGLTLSCCLSALNFVCMWLSQEVGPGTHWPQATDLGLQGDLDVGWGKRKINAAAGA